MCVNVGGWNWAVAAKKDLKKCFVWLLEGNQLLCLKGFKWNCVIAVENSVSEVDVESLKGNF